MEWDAWTGSKQQWRPSTRVGGKVPTLAWPEVRVQGAVGHAGVVMVDWAVTVLR